MHTGRWLDWSSRAAAGTRLQWKWVLYHCLSLHRTLHLHQSLHRSCHHGQFVVYIILYFNQISITDCGILLIIDHNNIIDYIVYVLIHAEYSFSYKGLWSSPEGRKRGIHTGTKSSCSCVFNWRVWANPLLFTQLPVNLKEFNMHFMSWKFLATW